jgi:Ca2+-binding EF-hand superfamily protein
MDATRFAHPPSEQEVEDILNEVKFSQYVETGEFVSKIDLGDFIKLYINHRPAFGLSIDVVSNAFSTLSGAGGGSIDRNQLLKLLESKGEHLTSDELVECINIFYGKAGLDFDEITEYLPGAITQEYFVNDLLGLNTY